MAPKLCVTFERFCAKSLDKMPRGYATRPRTLRAQGGGDDADKEMWMKMLEEERADNANLRARIKELEASGMVKTPIPTGCNKVFTNRI